MFSLLRRGRCCVRLAGTVVYNADEPVSWPDSDYGWVFRGFLTSTQTAGIVNLYVRTCSRTTRVTALRMGGTFHALGRANSCCARVQRVAGACFAIFIKQTSPLWVPGNRCILLDSLSPSRIQREMQHLGPFREGLCLCAYCEVVQIRSCALCASAHSLRRIRIRA